MPFLPDDCTKVERGVHSCSVLGFPLFGSSRYFSSETLTIFLWKSSRSHILYESSLFPNRCAPTKMALFRVLPRLCCFPRLYDCSGAGAAPLFLASLEKRLLQGENRPLCRTLAVYCRNGSLFEHTTTITLPQCAYLSTKAQKKKPQNTRKDHEHGSVLNELMSVKEDAQPTQLTVGAKGIPIAMYLYCNCPHSNVLLSEVVQAGKDFSYLLVVLGGFAVAGFLLWSVGSEFFSSNSPQTLYSKALKRVRQDMQVRVG